MFGSDIGHSDVVDMREQAAEAFAAVDDLIDETTS